MYVCMYNCHRVKRQSIGFTTFGIEPTEKALHEDGVGRFWQPQSRLVTWEQHQNPPSASTVWGKYINAYIDTYINTYIT